MTEPTFDRRNLLRAGTLITAGAATLAVSGSMAATVAPSTAPAQTGPRKPWLERRPTPACAMPSQRIRTAVGAYRADR